MDLFFAVRLVMRYSALGLLAVSMLFALVVINVIATPSHLAFAQTRAALPHFDHIVVVVEENHSYAQVIGSGSAPISIRSRVKALCLPIHMLFRTRANPII